MYDEALETAKFEELVGGSDRAFRLLRIYQNSYPSGTEYDRLFGHGMTREQVFRKTAISNGFTNRQINAFLNLQ